MQKILLPLIFLSVFFSLNAQEAQPEEVDTPTDCPGYQEPDPNRALDFAEYTASFPGGDLLMMDFIKTHLRYPQNACVSGRVIVRFVVEKDSTLSHVEVVRSMGEAWDKEALRVISLMPKWIPARQGSGAVRQRCTLPILFKL